MFPRPYDGDTEHLGRGPGGMAVDRPPDHEKGKNVQVQSTGMSRLLAMSTAIGSTLMLLSVGLRSPTVQADDAGPGTTLRTVLQRDTPSSFLGAAYNCPRRRATSDGSFRATGEIVAPDASGAYRPIGTFVETGTFTLDWADAALPWPELTN